MISSYRQEKNDYRSVRKALCLSLHQEIEVESNNCNLQQPQCIQNPDPYYMLQQ